MKNTFGTPRNPTVFTCFRPWKNGWLGSGADLSTCRLPVWTTWSLFRGEAWKPPTGQRGFNPSVEKLYFLVILTGIFTPDKGGYIYIDKYIQEIYIYIYTSITTRIFPPGTRRSFSGTRSSEGLGASQEFQGFSTMAWL